METPSPERSSHPSAHTAGTPWCWEPNSGAHKAAFGLCLSLARPPPASGGLRAAVPCVHAVSPLAGCRELPSYILTLHEQKERRGPETHVRHEAVARHGDSEPQTQSLLSLTPSPFSAVCVQPTNPDTDIFLLSLQCRLHSASTHLDCYDRKPQAARLRNKRNSIHAFGGCEVQDGGSG